MNTTDRELLELAAKAAGIELVDIDVIGGVCKTGPDQFCRWNPLNDDGDAFRLAVKLFDANEMAKIWNSVGGLQAGTEWNFDPYAATRRAIVHAAAEIGKEMK